MFKKNKKQIMVVTDDKPTVLITENEDKQNEKSPMKTPLYIDTALANHVGTRKYQQDSAYVLEPLNRQGDCFGVLCDGMGGMEDGELVSADVVAFLANALSNIPENMNIPKYYQELALEANEMILQKYVKQGKEAGTTLVSVLIQQNFLYWVSVGDSRIYIIRNQEIARMTTDHNYMLELQELVNAGSITQEEANHHPQKEALISYIGAPVIERIDMAKEPFLLQKEDIILLCSDGLTKSLRDQQILEQILLSDELADKARKLTVEALDASRGGQDNTTVILIRYLGGDGC
ncbi:MAG: protein phosphatase 2C domain-containing protein [Eubacteriales bacterium]